MAYAFAIYIYLPRLLIVILTQSSACFHLWQITTGNVRNHSQSFAKIHAPMFIALLFVLHLLLCFFSRDETPICHTLAGMIPSNTRQKRLTYRQHTGKWVRCASCEQGAPLNNTDWMWKVRVSKRKKGKLTQFFFLSLYFNLSFFSSWWVNEWVCAGAQIWTWLNSKIILIWDMEFHRFGWSWQMPAYEHATHSE